MSEDSPLVAFAVSFPHYFLNATGHLADQLKTREWIVARITSLTERVVDHKVGAFFEGKLWARVIDVIDRMQVRTPMDSVMG